MVQVNVGLIFLVLVEVLVTRGQNTCDTCISDTEYMECVTREILPCSIVGIDFTCVSDAPRDTLCQSPPPDCTQEGKFLFPGLKDECDRYYECDSSLIATTKFCTNGQLFSELQQDCVAPEDSECFLTSDSSTSINIAVSDQKLPSSSEQSSSSTEAPSTSLRVTTSPIVNTDVTTLSTLTNSPTSIETTTTVELVECTRIGRLPDPTNCKRFYTCIWRPFRREYMKVLRTCPFRLMYDTRRRMCRFNTHCGDRPISM